ncbi:Phenylalanyl-tRNA synthetase beta subunit [Legionella beliardensis]|uniref:Phenylalanine--tRNA ligase beta subunit n=1 Tax=Legionella beliardensis TaxID=91822 RepID=A0A378I562_9GAMM|nr:phenylalanine--tRNA ligase subunit beta [Legionella beliardensis]STX29865.1 Phenylalanyl-tRNA synthetase beta subunit [Legionella beliardensis]
MKVSENWLREWANPALNVEELAALLTMAGLEIDAINPVAGHFNKVIVAQVVQTKPHPQADRLTLCDVNIGKDYLLKIVCGAANVRTGLKVALAQIGAILPNDLTIKETKIRGELSQGMLCSATELGLLDVSEGIIELAEDAPIGADLREYLVLNDCVLDIDLTPNRADCLSVLGIAREVAALTQSNLVTIPTLTVKPHIDEQKTIHLEALDACPQYCGRIIRGINSQATTPFWMQERLRRAGLRVIHPVVDITNYVMLELGQPMHGFDLNQLKGDIVVRYSHENEAITLLDGQEVTLKEGVLLIADNDTPLAIAGVMGGVQSGVSETTTDIFLESAFFNPRAIAKVARRFNLFTDSAQRFERGVDPNLQVIAMERATSLLLEIVGGQAGPVTLKTEPEHLPTNPVIKFNPNKVKQLTGLDIAATEIGQMLSHLGMSVKKEEAIWQVTAPSYRFDIHLDVDLVEEIVRLYGYDKIQGTSMIAAIQAGVTNPAEVLLAKFNRFFIARNYYETISYSFVDPELQKILCPNVDALTLLNPISSELSQMRVSMWPGLIASMIHNIHRQQTTIKFYENGVIFNVVDGKIAEEHCLAGLLTGDFAPLSWVEEKRKIDFFDAKGDLEALFQLLQLEEVCFKPNDKHPALHPGKTAELIWQNQTIGWCGVLHPRIADALDLTDEVILFELKLKSLTKDNIVRYRKISKYPQIRRDLSFLVAKEVTIDQIKKVVVQVVKPELLRSFDVFDVYTGKHISADKKSLAIAITLQDNNRTLIDEEINEIISAIINKLNEEFAITLRD